MAQSGGIFMLASLAGTAADDAILAPESARRRPNVKVECTHLACVEGPNGTRHHVIFNPSVRTNRRMRAWLRSGNARGLTVEDRAGLHSRDTPASVVDIVEDYGTMVVTTDS